MNSFEFFTPTKVIFGRGSLENIGEEAKKLGKKGLVVTDKGMMKCGLAEKVIKYLEKENVNFLLWSEIVPNPRDVDIEKGAAYAMEQNIDYLIAVGGGSSMDTAKAMGALMTNGGKCENWYEGNLEKPIAPLICIPTTCGTGSEVTHESIVNNTRTLEKDCIWGPMVNVRVAILDSEMLDDLPGKILSSTGMDALTHAVEAYVCKVANPLTDAIAMKAIEMIGKNIREAVQQHTPEALDEMMAASTMAGMAFGNSDVACVHSISEALGGLYDIAHGVANAMMLAPVSRFSVKGAPEKYAKVAECLGVDVQGKSTLEAANAGIDVMQKLADEFQIPHFHELEVVNPRDFDRLAETAANADETEDNPIVMTKEDFIELFKKTYENKEI
ncbi:MAG: iron-containing alcohol dehydrogenase [Anaerostipes sp.]|nr:iron-containing alcohol dehydrogenase [Anaerostipes sp.]